MDIEKRLTNLKKIYREAEPSKYFLESGWRDCRDKMMHLEQVQASRSFSYLRPFVFTVMVFFILTGVLGGIVRASQGALPGEPLYPLKRLSEDVTVKISGNPVIQTENRAKEIVELHNKSRGSQEVKKAVEEYKTAVIEASSSGKNTEEFEEKLEEQENKFEEIKSGPSEKEINEAIEISKSGRGKDSSVEEQDRSGKDGGREEEKSDDNEENR